MHNKRMYFAVILFPLSLIYGVIVFFRNLLFDVGIIKPTGFRLPVISVGNITVGGTGKTPHVEYIVNLLKDYFSIAVLSRGYKRKSKGFQLAGSGSSFQETGDEPMQIKTRFPEIIVAVDSNRVHGIQHLITQFSHLQTVILDDAFQHRYVRPGLSIVLVDHNRPVFRDFLLPLGNLRESRFNINRADIVVVSKCPPEMDELQRRKFVRRLCLWHQQPVFFTFYRYGNIMPVFEEKANALVMAKDRQDNTGILLITGIADNRPLKDYLVQFFKNVVVMTFPDHHSYTTDDIRAVEKRFGDLPHNAKVIITTEKDAVRFRELPDAGQRIGEYLYYIPVEVKFLDNAGEIFNETVMNFCRGGADILNLQESAGPERV